MKKRKKILDLILIILNGYFFSSCNTFNPVAPSVVVTSKTIPEQPVSIIEIPIKINLAPYFAETNKSVPEKFTGNEQTCEGVSFSYKFIRDPLSFSSQKNKLWFDVTGKYALRLNYCPQCTELFNEKGNCIIPRIYTSCGVDEPMRKIQIAYSTNIQISKDYKLESKTKFENANALSPCEITVFNYDATKKLEEQLSNALREVEKDIDKEISSIDLKPQFEETWKLLSSPTRLEEYGFISMNPIGIALSDIIYNGDTAYFNAILQATPTIQTDTFNVQKKKLPSLSKYEKKNGFDISMDILASYDSLGAIATRNIKGKKIELEGREVIFGELAVHGASNNRINLKVDFSGKKKGTLYLTGTPVFDTMRQYISFPDLEFDLKTKDALLKSAKWLFNEKITKTIRESASMEFMPYLDSLKLILNENLNLELSEGIHLKGEVKKVYITHIHPSENELRLRIRSMGKLELNM